MKDTGVVRRIDELGRIVIPKEIRKNMRIKEGENLEIYIENENIILKKNSKLKHIKEIAPFLVDAINKSINKEIIITDRDIILACSKNLKDEYLNKKISEDLEIAINRRENIVEKFKKTIRIIDEVEIDCIYILKSIIADGDNVGLIIVLSFEEELNLIDEDIVNISTEFFSKYLAE